MELVYLWVGEYKNIHNQGFNFSPKFNCNYDPENKELTIKDNPNYIENFFGDHINVTAIVGKNGSGKSSILEIINILTNNQVNKKLNCKYILIFNNRKFISNINNIKSDFLNEKVKYKDIYTFSFFSETSLEKKYLERDIDISTEKIIELLRDVHVFNIFINSSKIFTFNPKILKFEALSKEKLLLRVESFFYEMTDNNNVESQKLINFLKKIRNENDVVWSQFILSKILQENTLSWLDNFEFSNLYEGVCKSFYNLENNESDDCSELDKEYYIFMLNLNLGEMSFQNIDEMQWQFLIKHKNILKFEFIDHKGLRYSDLSHGEKTIFSLFLHITRIIDDYIGRKHCLALLDEIDIPLHPNWQKFLIKSISSNAIKQNFIHYIITTHSPFLLSDIPKQNIIFLDTYKENDNEVKSKKQKIGNCKVVKGDDAIKMKQTFGANIHTLLSDSFFMKDGLMGEFAKGKINEIIDFHKVVEKEKHTTCLKKIYEKRKTKFWQTQSIIGEEYLKQIIKNHLVEIEKILLGNDEAKQQEIKRTKAYLKSLEND